MSVLRIALDGNEANVSHRVGSNVYAFELLTSIEELTKNSEEYEFTVLLREPPLADLPPSRKNWRYKVIKPSILWTQIGLPIHLFMHRDEYDILFTPGHYAPRLSAIPYISSVMDLAFLKYPDQFTHADFVQLKHWTAYSVAHAKKVVAISEATKQDVVHTYGKKSEDVVVAYPAVTPEPKTSSAVFDSFCAHYQVRSPYFLFVGTFQPRKNLIRLVEAFEEVCRELSSSSQKKKTLPQLVLAGKVGWLADETLARISASPFFEYIVLPGFIEDRLKPYVYERATASILVGLYEGFGLPPLESLHYGCLPIVSNTTSLPEVVGGAGILVDPLSVSDIAKGMKQALGLTAKQKAQFRKKAREQVKKFNWKESAQRVLELLRQSSYGT